MRSNDDDEGSSEPLSATEVGPGRFLDHEYLCVSVCVSLCVCMCSFVLVCVYMCVNVTPTHIKNTQICPDTETHTWSNFRFTKVGPDVFLCACAYVCACVCVFWCDTHRHMHYTRTTNIKTPRNTKTTKYSPYYHLYSHFCIRFSEYCFVGGDWWSTSYSSQ